MKTLYAAALFAASSAFAASNDYCSYDSKLIPSVNYSNSEVRKAAKVLATVSNFSYYFYSGPVYAYGLKGVKDDNLPPDAADAIGSKAAPDGKANAHKFLSILCGEFRDRPTLIAEKLRWVHKLYKLPVREQGPIDPSRPLWPQVTASGYQPYLQVAAYLYEMRRKEVNAKGEFGFGSYRVERPVQGSTVCETKYIFSEYVAKKRYFDSLELFEAGYKSFEPRCAPGDTDYYYDFRGDSNFKPNSPESNGMIWYASSVTNHCSSPTSAKGDKVTSEQCRAYFERPFASRWNGARAGMGAWMMRGPQHKAAFNDANTSIFVMPHFDGLAKPFFFKLGASGELRKDETDFILKPNDWKRSDFGFNALMNGDKGEIYERLRDAVNRHTDWYDSGWDDSRGMTRDQAYSPFVASSYVMAASDGFTAPGATVQSPSDGRKHWMFVFKIKKENWYNSDSIEQGLPVDFDRHWFDETSLGTNHLAKSERAWDRMGTAVEGEYDSILYLHNVATNYMVSHDGLPDPELTIPVSAPVVAAPTPPAPAPAPYVPPMPQAAPVYVAPTPPPAPVVQTATVEIKCESKGEKPNKEPCTAPGKIVSVKISKQESGTKCVPMDVWKNLPAKDGDDDMDQDHSGPYSYSGSSISVDKGCRAKFLVTYEK